MICFRLRSTAWASSGAGSCGGIPRSTRAVPTWKWRPAGTAQFRDPGPGRHFCSHAPPCRSPPWTVLVRPTTVVFRRPRLDPLRAARAASLATFPARTEVAKRGEQGPRTLRCLLIPKPSSSAPWNSRRWTSLISQGGGQEATFPTPRLSSAVLRALYAARRKPGFCVGVPGTRLT
jgi:hypothetical protein